MRKALFPGLLSLLLLVAAPVWAAESTRTLRAELPPGSAARFCVENLAGVMKVAPGKGPGVVAVATIHAESEKLAESMKFERVTGRDGIPTLRVTYPLDRYDTLRYEAGHHGHGALGGLFGNTSTSTRYDGRRVKISSNKGVVLYADVEVQVPRGGALEACFHNKVGRLEARGLEGKLKFDTSGGDMVLEHLKGEIQTDSGSGDVKASDLSGTFSCDTGSGDCALTGFEGEKILLDTGSGDLAVKSAAAVRISADTGSGDVLVTDSDVESFDADTGSGDVTFESRGSRLAKVQADTGSGDVVLRLDPGAGFEVRADQGSGDLRTGFEDAQPIIQRKRVVGYRRGDSRVRIDVTTGSGDLSIDPAR